MAGLLDNKDNFVYDVEIYTPEKLFEDVIGNIKEIKENFKKEEIFMQKLMKTLKTQVQSKNLMKKRKFRETL